MTGDDGGGGKAAGAEEQQRLTSRVVPTLHSQLVEIQRKRPLLVSREPPRPHTRHTTRRRRRHGQYEGGEDNNLGTASETVTAVDVRCEWKRRRGAVSEKRQDSGTVDATPFGCRGGRGRPFHSVVVPSPLPTSSTASIAFTHCASPSVAVLSLLPPLLPPLAIPFLWGRDGPHSSGDGVGSAGDAELQPVVVRTRHSDPPSPLHPHPPLPPLTSCPLL